MNPLERFNNLSGFSGFLLKCSPAWHRKFKAATPFRSSRLQSDLTEVSGISGRSGNLRRNTSVNFRWVTMYTRFLLAPRIGFRVSLPIRHQMLMSLVWRVSAVNEYTRGSACVFWRREGNVIKGFVWVWVNFVWCYQLCHYLNVSI
jgi:hypothetical protein